MQEAKPTGESAERAPSLISLQTVKKIFGSNVVLENVSFDLRPGEIHALVGENGAGKSTCLSMLYGLHQPTEGHILLDGQSSKIDSPSHAQTLGIGCVFQELSLAGSLSVAENIYAGRAPARFGVVHWTKLYRQAEALLAEFDLSIDVQRPVDSLPISTRQIVEIAKALSLNSRVLLLDEPTSALTPDEVAGLFTVLRNLTKKGIGIVYVSHHMTEIFDIADRITVLRDGHCISTQKTSNTTQPQVVSEMTGQLQLDDIKSATAELGEVVLQVEQLCHNEHYQNISFSLRKGEILGLAGLLGSRRSEIVRTLAGLIQNNSGSIRLNGSEVNFSSIREAMSAGIGFIPEERKTEGLFLESSISENLVAADLQKHTTLGFVNRRTIRRASVQAIETFSVKTEGPEQLIGALSGGNQQKIMLAKWLQRSPDILIIEEPTKGVDVGAKYQIHRELQRRAQEGMAIIIVSSDFPELLSLSQHLIVIHEGRVTGDFSEQIITEQELLHLAAGAPLTAENSNQNTEEYSQ